MLSYASSCARYVHLYRDSRGWDFSQLIQPLEIWDHSHTHFQSFCFRWVLSDLQRIQTPFTRRHTRRLPCHKSILNWSNFERNSTLSRCQKCPRWETKGLGLMNWNLTLPTRHWLYIHTYTYQNTYIRARRSGASGCQRQSGVAK